MSGRPPTTAAAILSAVMDRGTLTSAQVCSLISGDPACVRSLMARMAKEGVLITSGNKRCFTYSLGVLKVRKPMLMERAKPTSHNPDRSKSRSKATWDETTPAQTTSKTIYTYGKPMQQPTRTNTHSYW